MHQGQLRDWQNQIGGAAAATTFSQKQPNLEDPGSYCGEGVGAQQGTPGRRDKLEPHMLQSLLPTLGRRSLAHSTFTQNPILLGAWSCSSGSQCRSQAWCMGLRLWPKSWAGEGLLRPEQESEPCMLMPQMYSIAFQKGLRVWGHDTGFWSRTQRPNPKATATSS